MQYPSPVNIIEPLARFVLERSKFRPSDNTARHSLFLPAPDNVLSVFRILDLDETEVFSLGEEYVGVPQAKPVIAYAALVAQDFLMEGLVLTPTVDPHPRHVDIVGWNDKVQNLHKAQILASKSTLVLRRT